MPPPTRGRESCTEGNELTIILRDRHLWYPLADAGNEYCHGLRPQRAAQEGNAGDDRGPEEAERSRRQGHAVRAGQILQVDCLWSQCGHYVGHLGVEWVSSYSSALSESATARRSEG